MVNLSFLFLILIVKAPWEPHDFRNRHGLTSSVPVVDVGLSVLIKEVDVKLYVLNGE